MHQTIRSLEGWGALDGVARPVMERIRRLVRPRIVRNLLSGTYLGHPLHPMLTDVPIGAWGMAALLDAVGGRAVEPTADLLVKVGAVAALPTAAAGLNDWSDTDGPAKRVGLVHGTANTLALSLYMGSLVARGRATVAAARCSGCPASGSFSWAVIWVAT